MKVSINMAMSMDGKIATAKRGPMKLGTDYDSKRMAQIRGQNDAVINGATTFLVYPFPLLAKGAKKQPISAIVSSKLRIPRNTPWEKAVDIERWVFCGQGAPKKTIRSLESSGVNVVVAKGKRPTPSEILDAFKRAGVKRVLLEGGGEFNASFLEEGLVDEIYLTLVPKIIGGVDSPTWFEGRGYPKKFPRFRLKESRKVKDELYLVYRR